MPETENVLNPHLRNPHLEGDPFFWEGGPDGILLIHGFTATTAEVLPLARYLYGQGYTVAGPLLPGHKARPADINRYGWRDWVQTVEKAYREIASRCRRVVVGGESTGGLLALYLAQQHPEVAAILAYAPALKLTIRRRDVVQLYLFSPFLESVPKKPGPPTAADELWQGYPVNPLKGVIALLQLQRQVYPHLKTITQPILIVQGRLDETVHPDVPQMIYDGVHSTIKEMHWMERSSHCVILDQEREHIFDLTAQFLTRVLR
ncbi:MAG: alpha/beta fold hydrolase [Anaerolineae bacterium]|nr:alpha/beta fold hydrolase [Anaerolineae bacterium]